MQLENNNILNNEDTLYLLNEYNKGNKKAMEKLILHNLRFIIYVVKKYESDYLSNDELISIGTIGFIKAINTFNTNRGVKLTTYVSKCIDDEILIYMKKIKKFKNEISIKDIIKINEYGIECVLIDKTQNIEETVIKKLENDLINNIFNELSNRDCEIIKLYYGFYKGITYTQEEISMIYNISQSRVSRIIKKTLPKIKQKYLERV